MNNMKTEKLRETRRQMIANIEETLLKGKSPEDSVFYYHSSVLSISALLACAEIGTFT